MSELPREERLSAYLDGELTAAERAEVETLLADDADSRQLLDELRALRRDVQQLPKYELGPDFSQRVLRQAERSMLMDSSHPPDASSQAWDDDRRWRWSRRLAWPGIAIAAAILISVFTQFSERNEGERSVAVAPERSAETTTQAPREPADRDVTSDDAMEARTRAMPPSSDAPDNFFEKGMQTFTSPAPDATQEPPAAEDLLIVEAEVDPQAFRDGAFAKLLAEQDIALDDLAATPTEGLAESAEVAVSDVDVEYVYVEAPLSQIEAALAEMQAQPSQFVSLKVDPAPADGRQSTFIQQYARSSLVDDREAAVAKEGRPPAAGLPVAETDAPMGQTVPPLQAEAEFRRNVVKVLPRQIGEQQQDARGRAQRILVAPAQQAELDALSFPLQKGGAMSRAAAPVDEEAAAKALQQKSRALFLLRSAPVEK